jgi:hypothetical protein
VVAVKRSRILVAVSFVALASTVAVAWAGAGPASERVSSPRELRGVNFVSGCGFSHRAPDDPIVFPRKPGFSHDHTFVGNQSTNAFSTLRTLRAATTTCRRAGDTAAYWAPTLIAGTRAVEPLGATIYYRRRSLGDVTAFPAGLKMIAGDQHAMRPQSLRVTFWNCGVMAGLPPSSTVPTCPAGRATSLRLHVLFPDCWNGKTLDSADHKRHMAYSVRGQCPASHPVAVPAIALILRYPSFGGPNLQLSSGGQLSGHADFFNAWDQAELTRLVDTCLNALRHCGRES